MKKNLVILLLVVLLVGSNLWQFFNTLDIAVTLSHRENLLHSCEKENDGLEKIATSFMQNMDVNNARDLLQGLFPDEEIYFKEDRLNSTWLSIKLHSNNQKVHSVGYESTN